ncbi:bifunctional UDP-N-acetylglucosamine diphosphorylase/glucosamine-1-phosphate N-acetyltransferase GlmU [Marisediminicola senii]|uniref:bifunctional UDP-N-acetylglucosamine diphosphorylase/glucosamine-1-phosphate N-acetyltransferase GlmU n=1 Tax=Marisediminicola senii TaxID=2711233 RepID=UPI0013EB4B20|nr:bifunctional UDP-N-acetylglucosamine diphosphorylase/glucosamine-1-phosphate N-acetyltransferase GlmU [Marisediminicola senii]
MTDADLAVIILSAGQGTRMRSARAKVLHSIAGVPLVGHVVATADELDAAHVIAVVRHERDAVAAAIVDYLPSAVIVDQDDLPGTGRAVEVALEALPDTFTGDVVVLSADVPLLDAGTIAAMVASHRAAGNALTLLSAHFDDPTGGGRILRDDAGRFHSIVEQKDASPEQLEVREVNGGVYVFGVPLLRTVLAGIGADNAQKEKYLTDAAAGMKAAGGAIAAMPVSDPWLIAGVNDRAQLTAAATELNARIIRRWQLAGVTVHDPATTWIDLKVTLAEDVEVLPGTQLKGATTIERGAIVGPDTTLVDCEVGEYAVVKRTDATLAVIGAAASVGPFSYLRPGTVLGADGKIGTFVETKNSVIGEGSKVPHLSYLGDTTVGVGSNVGAGTITANYDGVNKHRTEVGSHVRTGSHNVFVAPVRIGDGAYTGAGTVVRKDVPAGALSITAAPQRNITDWVQTNRAGTAAATAAAAAHEQKPDPES